MDIKRLVRHPKKVHDALSELPDGRLVAKKQVKIYIPSRFEERNLAEVGVEVTIVGIYAIVVDDTYYGVSLVNAMMRITPSSIVEISIDDVGYYEFTFDAGDTILPSVNLVKSDVLVYNIFDEIISKGRVPWYLSYDDLGRLFDTAKYHADANIGTRHEVTELLVSIIGRNSKDKYQYYRQIVKSKDDLIKNPPAYISLRDIAYTATNTVNKLAGSYFETGLVSALVNPTDRVEKLECVLRR